MLPTHKSDASCVIPPQQLTTTRLPVQEVLQKQKTKSPQVSRQQTQLLYQITCFSVELWGSFSQTEPWLSGARGEQTETRYSPGMAGRRTQFVECCRKVLRAVPTATLSAPSEERREVFPRLHWDLLVKLCPLPPAGATWETTTEEKLKKQNKTKQNKTKQNKTKKSKLKGKRNNNRSGS